MDLKTLHKLESLPASVQAKPRSDDESVLVVIKTRAGFNLPSYVTPRAKMGDRMFSAQVLGSDLSRLQTDPAVESMSMSRSIQVIE